MPPESPQESKIHRLTQLQFVRFAGVGVVSTCVDIALYKVFLAVVSVYLATAIGFFSGLTVGFFLNGRYVFQQARTRERYLKYGLVSFGGFCLTEGIIHVLYVSFRLVGPLPAKLVAVALVFFWNYGWSKAWAFR